MSSPVVKAEPSEPAVAAATPPSSSSSSRKPKSKKEEAAATPPASTAPVAAQKPDMLEYRDLPLRSMDASDPWLHHIMRLAHHTPIDLNDTRLFVPPVKLNRKQPPKLRQPPPREGDPVLDKNGKPVMINVPTSVDDPHAAAPGLENKRTPLTWPGPDQDTAYLEEYMRKLKPQKGPSADTSLIAPTSTNAAQRRQTKRFQRRVREIHKSSASARRTFNQEYLPWVLEDHETAKEWESARALPPVGLAALEADLERRKEGLASIVQRAPPKKEEGATSAVDDSGSGVVKMETDSPSAAAATPAAASSSSHGNHAPWIGKLEGDSAEGSTHVLFVFDERPPGGFIVVPVSRMYKFLQKPKHALGISAEEAEKEFEKHQKARIGEADRWMLRARGGEAGPSRSAGSAASGPAWPGRGSGGGGGGPGGARVKKEERDEDILAAFPEYTNLKLPGGGYLGARTGPDGSRQLRVVNAERSSGGGRRRIKREPDEGTYGELDYEEDFQDDDEAIIGEEPGLLDEEARELEEKLKREMAKAGSGEADDAEDDEDDLFGEGGGGGVGAPGRPGRREDDMLTGSGKQMRKIMRALGRREGNDAYERDDDEVNPYASEEESGDEDTVMANPEKALREVIEERERQEREARQLQQQQQEQEQAASAGSKQASADASRGGTPGGRGEKRGGGQATPSGSGRGAPGGKAVAAAAEGGARARRPGAGHADVAQRATSPKRQLSGKVAGGSSRHGSRSGSPGATSASAREGGGGRGTSPPPSAGLKRSRADSGSDNAAAAAAVAATTTTLAPSADAKRARLGDGESRASPSRNSRDGSPRSPVPPGSRRPDNDIEAELISLIRKGEVSDMKQLVLRFGSRVKRDASVKEMLMRGVKKIVVHEGGGLRLREGY